MTRQDFEDFDFARAWKACDPSAVIYLRERIELYTRDDGTGSARWTHSPLNRAHLSGREAGYVGTKIRHSSGRLLNVPYTRVTVSIQNRTYIFSRIIYAIYTGEVPQKHVVIDHKNKNPLDNSPGNLGLEPRVGNNQNTGARRIYNGKPPASPYKGVYLDRGTPRAQIRVAGRSHHIGRFTTDEEAHRTYEAFAHIFHANRPARAMGQTDSEQAAIDDDFPPALLPRLFHILPRVLSPD